MRLVDVSLGGRVLGAQGGWPARRRGWRDSLAFMLVWGRCWLPHTQGGNRSRGAGDDLVGRLNDHEGSRVLGEQSSSWLARRRLFEECEGADDGAACGRRDGEVDSKERAVWAGRSMIGRDLEGPIRRLFFFFRVRVPPGGGE